MKCCGSARHSSLIPASTDHCCRTFCCGGHAPSSTTYGTRSTRSPALADTGIKAIWYSVPSNFRDWLSCFLLVKYGNAVKNARRTDDVSNEKRSVGLSLGVCRVLRGDSADRGLISGSGTPPLGDAKWYH